MRVSIWQQFSSNHSNDFTIVGHFKALEDAKNAADELKTILRTIHDWYGTNSEKHAPHFEGGKFIPSNVEQRIAANYNIQWDTFHEWILYYASYPEQAVTLVDQWIFMDSPNTWAGYGPFDKVLRQMGGNVIAEEEMGEMRIFVNVRAAAPNEDKAQVLGETIKQYLREKYEYLLPGGGYASNDTSLHPIAPWVFYAGYRPNATNEAILDATKQHEIYSQTLDGLAEVWRQLKRADFPDDHPKVIAASQAIEDYRKTLPDNISQLAFWFIMTNLDVGPILHGNYEKITINTNIIQIDNLWFSARLGKGLSALIAWLRAEGCEVRWEFRQQVYPGEES